MFQPATPCTQACNPRAQPVIASVAPFATQAHKIATLLRARGHMQAGGGVKVGGVESFQGQARTHARSRLQPY